jgi:hypothetical protein
MRTNSRRGQRAARRDRSLRWLAVPAGLVASSLLVWQASNAAFTATTDNPGNSWASGDVVLTDDDGGGVGSAMFAATNLKPGSTGERCITVTYSGSLDASVKLYASAGGTGLAQYLDLTVEQGSSTSPFGDCSTFSADGSPVYNGTVAGFATAHNNYGSGWGSFTPSGGTPDDKKTYRITYTLQDNNLAQAKDASATFTWEAQNTP